MDKYNTRATIEDTGFWDTFVTTTKEGKKKLSIRFWRWATIIGVHLIFVLSFKLDIQMLEGTLSGSRFLGFHLIDPFMAFQVFAAHNSFPINLIIGTVTIVIFYLLVGGRSYCSWVCPYGLLSEIGEKINAYLIKKKIIKRRKFDHRVRYLFLAIFLVLAFITGFLVFETINVVGIISRALIYGWGLALVWTLAVLLIEIFYSQRAWCRYICPIGTTYSFIGWPSATKIVWSDKCDHCMVCHNVCLVPHVLEITKKNYDHSGRTKEFVLSGDCTLCGRCVEVCHVDALSYETKLKKII